MTDNLAAEARRLRTVEGLSTGQIRQRLGIGKDLLYDLLRGVPAPEWTRRPNAKDELRAGAVRLRETGWSVTDIAQDRDQRQAAVHAVEADRVGSLSERDLLLVGAAIYWCEGSKSKPWRRNDRLTFTNSDAGLLALFLYFLESCGVDRRTPTYRLSIHESAGVDAATAWWIQVLGLPAERGAITDAEATPRYDESA
jgi:hypothetical protein